MKLVKIKVRQKKGKIVEYPISKIKDILETTGYSGRLLVKGTGEVFKEAKKLTKNGVISATNFEKAVVRGIGNTNKIVMNTAQKTTKNILK